MRKNTIRGPRSGSSNRAIVEKCVQTADSVAKTFSPVTR